MKYLHSKRNILRAALALALSVMMAVLMSACSTADGSIISLEEFTKACEDDGLTVADGSQSSESSSDSSADTASQTEENDTDAPDYAGLQTVYTAEHGTENILVQVMIFSDEKSASDAFGQFTASIDPGPSGTVTTTDTSKYTKVDTKADNRYTRAILDGRQIISAGGPTMYESEMNRIIQKFGYQ